MIDGGAEDKYMALHNGSTWYCSDCDSDSDCGEPGGGQIHEEDPGGFAAAVRSGDDDTLREAVSDWSRYVLVNKEVGLLAFTDCKGVPVAQYKLTPAQMLAITE